jgi:hypothetical protein
LALLPISGVKKQNPTRSQITNQHKHYYFLGLNKKEAVDAAFASLPPGLKLKKKQSLLWGMLKELEFLDTGIHLR